MRETSGVTSRIHAQEVSDLNDSTVGYSDLAARTLAALGKVVVQPGPLLKLLDARPDDPDEVTAAIESSPALVGRVLSVTNSAGVGLYRQIDSVRRAVVHLGPSRARTVALAFGLRILAEECNLPQDLLQSMWVSSLRKAAAARLAAQIIDPRHTDNAYTMALLQDIGLPLLMAVDPAFYAQPLTPGPDTGSWSDQEYRHFGIDHATIGSRLLEEWSVSSKARDAVLDHHHIPTQMQNNGEALQRLPGFIASVMPHLGEPMSPQDHDWLIALHAQFLFTQYPSPQSFLNEAAKAAAAMHTGVPAAYEKLDEQQVARAVQVLHTDSESMVSQLSQLEQALGKQREHMTHLRFQAFTDQLTKVLNRRGFERLAQRRIEAAVERRIPVCVCVIDLDDFKPVNDRFGHEAGDTMLRALAKLMRRSVDRSDLIGRLGGDEFVVLVTGADQARSKQIVQRIAGACLGTKVRVTPTDAVPIKMSMGAVFCPSLDEGIDIDELISAADEAMYSRKKSGKGGLVFTRYEAWQK